MAILLWWGVTRNCIIKPICLVGSLGLKLQFPSLIWWLFQDVLPGIYQKSVYMGIFRWICWYFHILWILKENNRCFGPWAWMGIWMITNPVCFVLTIWRILSLKLMKTGFFQNKRTNILCISLLYIILILMSIIIPNFFVWWGIIIFFWTFCISEGSASISMMKRKPDCLESWVLGTPWRRANNWWRKLWIH